MRYAKNLFIRMFKSGLLPEGMVNPIRFHVFFHAPGRLLLDGDERNVRQGWDFPPFALETRALKISNNTDIAGDRQAATDGNPFWFKILSMNAARFPFAIQQEYGTLR